MNAIEGSEATRALEVSEVFGRDIEMQGPMRRSSRVDGIHPSPTDLVVANDRLTAELELTLERMDRARSYVLDPDSDGELSALLLRKLVRRRLELTANLDSIRVAVHGPDGREVRSANI